MILISEVLQARKEYEDLMRDFLIQNGWESDGYFQWKKEGVVDEYLYTDEEALWYEEGLLKYSDG